VDDSRQDGTRSLPVWPASYHAEGQIGPLGALTVNKGMTSIKPPRVVDDGAVYAGNELARLLRARGVSVGGTATHGKAPDNALDIAKVDSAPLKAIAEEVVRSSDNGGAEDLMREIGVRAARDGTTQGGINAAVAKLSELGVPMAGVHLVDGSGLARDNRVTCAALANVVDLGARPEFASLWSGLSVAGRNGTLADELLGTGLEGRLRGKTGFLNGVTGLAGLVDAGRAIRFAFVVNGNFGETQAIKLRGQLAQIIARFPQSPSGNDLVPAPTPPAPRPAAP